MKFLNINLVLSLKYLIFIMVAEIVYIISYFWKGFWEIYFLFVIKFNLKMQKLESMSKQTTKKTS